MTANSHHTVRLSGRGSSPSSRVWSLVLALALLLSVTGSGSVLALPANDPCGEPNDEPDKACELRENQTAEGELSSSADADRYRIEVKAGQSIQVTVNGQRGNMKLRLEASGGASVAEIGLGPGQRQVLAERLPEGRYFVYLAGDDADPRTSYPYNVGWKVVGSGEPVSLETRRGNLRDLALTPSDAGELAVQTQSKMLVTDVGRVYEVVYEREDAVVPRRRGPVYLLNRVHVADSAERASAVYDVWNIFDVPEANEKRRYESLGDENMPPFGDAVHTLGACYKCDDENPERTYRLVARFDNVVYMLYAWGRDSGTNMNTLIFLANKLPAKL